MSASSPLLLAVDAGGSNTRAVVVEPDGTCLGYGLGPAGNPTSAGPESALRGIAEAAAAALRQAERPPTAVGSVLVALAGSQDLLRPDLLAQVVGFTGGPARLRMVSDILAMYHSGAAEPTGCAVIAGTGSIAARVSGGEVTLVFGGSGWLLGDGGSGFAIGHRVVRAVVAQLDGIAPDTALTDLLLAELGIADDGSLERGRSAALARLMGILYRERPVVLARYAPLAFTAGSDPVAAAIVEHAQDDLAALVVTGRGNDPQGPVVLGGSVMHHGVLAPGMARSTALVAALEGADVRPARDGAVGAAVLGLAQPGRPLTADVFERLRRTAALVRGPGHAAGAGPAAGAGSVDVERVR